MEKTLQPSSKTPREWFKRLPEPARTQAISNITVKNRSQKFKTLHDAIEGAFLWETTPEGGDYWSDVYYQSKEERKIKNTVGKVKAKNTHSWKQVYERPRYSIHEAHKVHQCRNCGAVRVDDGTWMKKYYRLGKQIGQREGCKP